MPNEQKIDIPLVCGFKSSTIVLKLSKWRKPSFIQGKLKHGI